MMNTDKKLLFGKDLLDKLQMIIFFVIYTIIIVMGFVGTKMRLNPQFIGYFIITIVIFIIIFIAIQQYILRLMSEKHAGRPVMGGWQDEENGVGEEYEWIIEEMIPFENLSQIDKEAIDSFVQLEYMKIQNFENEGPNRKLYLRLKQEVLANESI